MSSSGNLSVKHMEIKRALDSWTPVKFGLEVENEDIKKGQSPRFVGGIKWDLTSTCSTKFLKKLQKTLEMFLESFHKRNRLNCIFRLDFDAEFVQIEKSCHRILLFFTDPELFSMFLLCQPRRKTADPSQDEALLAVSTASPFTPKSFRNSET